MGGTLDISFLLTGTHAADLGQGLLVTLTLFICSFLFAVIFALLLASIRALPVRPLRLLVAAIVEYHRNVPVLVQILIWYFAVPQVLPDPLRLWLNRQDGEFLFSMIALALNSGAFMSEDLRSGLRAVPAAQFDAARSLGLSQMGALRYVMLPQALRIAVPAIINQTLFLFKNTSLAMAVAVGELTYRMHEIENTTFRTFEIFMFGTIAYLTFSFSLMGLGAWFSRRYPSAHRI